MRSTPLPTQLPSKPKLNPRHILIIKLGALGDFILSDSAFKAIRDEYPGAKITLLTTPTFQKFASKLGHFDDVVAFDRFSFLNFTKVFEFIAWIKSTHVDLIFDLQMVDRTRNYYYLFKIFSPTTFRWVGNVRSSSYFLEDVYFKKHPSERFSRLLSKVSIPEPLPLDLRRLAEPLEIKGLSKKYILMVPSTSNAFNGAKTWNLKKYKSLIPHLTQLGYDIVIIGGPSDDHSALCVNKNVFDLTGKTSFEQIFYVASHATAAIGGDTGPIHMAAASKCPVFVMFSKIAPPAEQVGARGEAYYHLSVANLNDLGVEEVRMKFTKFLEEQSPCNTTL